MTVSGARSLSNEGTTTNVVPFRKVIETASDIGAFDESTYAIIDANELKTLIESITLNVLIQKRFEETLGVDDPFDAIYLSELRPDDIGQNDIRKIVSYSRIKDISDSIKFDDEWGD